MWAGVRTHVHTNTQGSKDTKTEGSPGIWKRARAPSVGQSVSSCPPAIPAGTARPPGPSGHREPWAQSQPGRRGVALIVPLVAHPAEETVTGNAMEGYSASNYYFEKGEKNAEGETVPTQIISLGDGRLFQGKDILKSLQSI